MNQDILQNNQNDPTFTGFNNMQSTVIQPEHSSIINYYDVNVNSSDNNFNNFPTFYTNTNNSDQQLTQPTTNEYIASTSSYTPHYVGPQQPIENIPSPLGSLNMTSIHPSNSEILSFDIPGFKIIVIPISSQQQDNTYLNYSFSNLSDNQFTQFTQFQP
jgi:hypothetical protein